MFDSDKNPDFILDKIAEFLPDIFLKYSQLNHHYAKFFSSRKNEVLDELRKLLNHAALGGWFFADKIWQSNPALLTYRGTIYHPNRSYKDADGEPLSIPIDIPFEHNPGRYKYINRTAWQIAVMNEEMVEANKMGQLMTAKQKQEQYAEIFPDGEMKKYDWDMELAKQYLRGVFDAVAKDDFKKTDNFDNMNDETRTALKKLYAYAKPKTELEYGLVFDVSLYLEALKMYDASAHDKFDYNTVRLAFWCTRVEEWLAGCLGTGYLRHHARGIGCKTIDRAGCFMARGSSYFVFKRNSDSIPGRDFYVGYNGGDAHGARRTSATCAVGGCFCYLNTSYFQNLYDVQMQARNEFVQTFKREELVSNSLSMNRI